MRPRFDIVLTAAVVVSIGATFVPHRAVAETTPYQATVVTDNVEVRAGYSRTFYVVGQLHRDAAVTVAEEPDGWYKIVPPSGVYSIISKGFVDARGDGKTGVVNSDGSIVKADAADPNEFSYREQTRLKKGDTVQIAGEQGSFYKIVPPQGAFVFLPPESVKPTSGGAGAATPPAAAPTPEPTPAAPTPEVKPTEPAPKAAAPAAPTETETPVAPKPKPTHHEEAVHAAATETPAPFESSEPAPKPTPAPAAEPTPAPAPSAPRPAQPDSPALQDAENKLATAGKLPLNEQPLEELLATYQGLSGDANLSLVDRRIVAVRLGQLHRNIEIAKGLKSLDEAKTAASETIEMPKTEQPPEGVYNPSKYDLVGQLLSSGVYNGDTGPRLFRLVEPASMRTLAYVQTGRLWSPRTTLGRIVGIMGETRYDPALKLRIVDVKKMDVLEPTGTRAPAASSSDGSSPTGSTSSSPTAKPSPSKGKESSKPATQPAKGETTELMK